MAVSQQSGLREVLYEALEQACKTSRQVLISSVQPAPDTDPLLFFEMRKMLSYQTHALWSDPNKCLTFVGLGATYKIEAEQSKLDRYTAVEQAWEQLLQENRMTTNQNISGTGPILMGGFSFERTTKQTERWRNFPSGLFILPRFLLTNKGEESWLTVNVLLSPHDHKGTIDQLLHEYELLSNCGDHDVETDHAHHKTTVHEANKDRWMASVNEVIQDLKEGELEKVVLARELELESHDPISPYQVLANLREEQPGSYLFAFENEGTCFLGASPERLIKKNGDHFLSTCLAGSIARGNTVKEDEALGEQLLHDQKNLHEHAFVVDMIRQAMEQCCSEVVVPSRPDLYKLRDIQHLYTPIIGVPNEGVSLLNMIRLLHPTPALGGHPRDLAMQKIEQVEMFDRGWYAAPIGWLDSAGNGEFAVAIRSGLIQGTKATLFAGCGIVADSDAQKEYEETTMKFRPMRSAIEGAKQNE